MAQVPLESVLQTESFPRLASRTAMQQAVDVQQPHAPDVLSALLVSLCAVWSPLTGL